LFGELDKCREFRRELRTEEVLAAHVPEADKNFGVRSVPFAVLIGRDGVVLSKGMINHVEHIESLLAARDAQSEENGGHLLPSKAAVQVVSRESMDIAEVRS
jgi:hypothetical protein